MTKKEIVAKAAAAAGISKSKAEITINRPFTIRLRQSLNKNYGIFWATMGDRINICCCSANINDYQFTKSLNLLCSFGQERGSF